MAQWLKRTSLVMSTSESNLWTRRRLLQVIPAALASAMIANGHRTFASYPTSTSAFSSFLDVAASAGLTQTMFYGEAHKATHIIEIMGSGYAFFHYHHARWVDTVNP